MNDEWVVAYYAKDPIEAELLKGLLESQSINARVSSNGMIGGVGELPADAIETSIKVMPEDYNQARQVLESYEKDDSKEIFCPECGETNFANFELCWCCGKALASP